MYHDINAKLNAGSEAGSYVTYELTTFYLKSENEMHTLFVSIVTPHLHITKYATIFA